MKRFIWLSLMVLAFSGQGLSQVSLREDNHSLREADNLFKKGKFVDAFKIYESLNVNNPGQFHILLNMGECLFLTRDPGNALPYYEEAQKVLENSSRSINYQKNKMLLDKRITSCKQMEIELGVKYKPEKTISNKKTEDNIINPSNKPKEKENKYEEPSPSEVKTLTNQNNTEDKEPVRTSLVFQDNHTGNSWKIFDHNPISFRRYNMIPDKDPEWRIPTETELLGIINYALDQKDKGDDSWIQFLHIGEGSTPFFTSDSDFQMGSQQYHCIRFSNDKPVIEMREDLDEVNIILVRTKN